MDRADVVVVGGGVSGLSFAYHAAARGKQTVVLERNAQAGGCIRSHRTGSGYWLELGAHTSYNSYGGFLELIEGCGLSGSLRPRAKVPFRLLRDGKLRSIPGELGIPAILWRAPRILWMKKEQRTVRSYYERLVGPDNYERVLRHFLAAVPSQSADDFPATMLFKKRPRRKDVVRSFTLDGGLQTVLDAIATRPGITLRTGAEVSSIEREGTGFVVTTSDGARLVASTLALATPPATGARLLETVAPETAALLRQIKSVRVESVGVVAPKAKLTVEPVAGIVPVDGPFHSAVSRDTVPDEQRRGFAFHFKPGGDLESRLGQICELLQLQRGDLEEIARNEVELPSPVLGHEAVVAGLDRQLHGTRLALLGNYFAGLAIEDCVERSRAELERLLPVS